MAAKSRKGRASASVNVDLSGVETSRKTIPEGRYPLVVDNVTQKNSREGNPMIAFEFSVAEGKHQGSKLYENCSLQPQALFKLKSVLIALGMDIPNKAFDLDLKDLIGLTCEAEIGHETYEGKKKARILEYLDPNDSEDDDDSDDDSDEDDTDLESTLMEMDLDDLKDLAKELEIPASSVKKAKKVKALVELIMSEADEDDILEALGDDNDEDDDDEDDEDEEKDYSEMSLAELKAECKDRGLKGKKGMDKDDLIEMLEEDDED